ncbi:MAG: DEAD/DEAH box helicase, partial [Candidatus Aenigmatarchaeota archaeon]
MAIEFVKKPFKDKENLSYLESYVKEWFVKTFKELTPPQKYSFKLISEGHNVVITAPTGSGKTIAGFLSILSELFKMGKEGKLKDSVYCIYVSPLKALDNDIKRNLLIPLKEIREIAKNKGIDLPEVRIAVRSGDVTPHEKQKQLKQPPHILITTPESLAVMLNAPKFSKYLSTVKWVIVDEIHELANNKRGVHLSLSLERLQEIAGNFIRIGLGATLHPIENAAAFLVGYNDNGELRDCKIVDVSWYKPYDLKVLCPVKDIVHSTAEQLNSAMYNLLDKLISKHRTTLIFTNTRSGTERVVFHLKDKWKNKYSDATIGAHHGSLSRDIRLSVE